MGWKPLFFFAYVSFLGSLHGQGGQPFLHENPAFRSSDEPRAVALGMLDADARTDFAIADASTDGLAVFLQQAPLAFAGPQRLDAGDSFEDVAVADLNADGALDLAAVTLASPSDVRIYLGDGSGGFTKTFDSELSGSASALLVQDVDANGNPDVLVSLSDTGDVVVLLGAGDGTLGTATAFTAAVGVNDLVLGDVSGDGVLDLVTANGTAGSVAILTGNGSGGFSTPLLRPGLFPLELRLTDVDSDVDLDIVAVSSTTPNLVVIDNLGGGVFGAFETTTIQAVALSLELDDRTGDGVQDVIIGYGNEMQRFSVNEFSVYAGDGAGGFSVLQNVGDSDQSDETSDVAIEDIDGDGLRDVVFISPQRNATSFYRATSAGGFAGRSTVGTDREPRGLALADMNGDGTLDLVTASLSSPTSGGTVSVFLGDGSGGFSAPIVEGTSADDVRIADVTNDGVLDVVILAQVLGQLCVAEGNGDGSLDLISCLNPLHVVSDYAIGDADGDGNPDVFSVSTGADQLLISLGDGAGDLAQGGPTVFLGGSPGRIEVVDLDADGDDDAVVADSSTKALILLFNDGFGDLSTRVDVSVPAADAFELAVADFDRNGSPDVVTDGDDSFVVALGLGGGAFSSPTSYPIGGTNFLCVTDMNSDGWPDVVCGEDFQVSMALSNASGGFRVPLFHGGVDFPRGFTCGDLDNDGYGEILSLDAAEDVVQIYGNLSPTDPRVTIRNGSGVNPLCFSSMSDPVIGSSWDVFVDASGSPASTFTGVFGYDRGLPGILTGFGELLVGVEPIGVLVASGLQPVMGGGSMHSFPIPLELGLLGQFVAAQAVLLGAGPELCNALDVILGD